MMNDNINFGDRRIVGQDQAANQVEKIFRSGRLSHAYLLTGPPGSGKTAFALAMAEIVNGIDNLTNLKGSGISKKNSWFKHPDIHLFIPLPTSASTDELNQRIKMLSEDPYEIVDFSLRPALNTDDSSKNRRAFYSIDYYRDEIRPVTILKPNEGRRTIVILTGVDTMRKESANAFLKLLEEPSKNIFFILTAKNTDGLLPTIVSRCQQIRLKPLTADEVSNALIQYDEIKKEDAEFLARISDGNYSLTRFLDPKQLKNSREELIAFLRHSYTQNAPELLKQIGKWHSKLNLESQIALCNTLEILLRDIMIYSETESAELLINADQVDVIRKFCSSLKEARIGEMIEQLQHLKMMLYQNVQFKLVFTSLSFRFTNLMRGLDHEINNNNEWKHLPAFTGN